MPSVRAPLLLPGLLALQRGQLVGGLALVSAALVMLAAIPASLLVVATPLPCVAGLVGGYLALLLLGVVLDRATRARPLDPASVRSAHRAVVRAWVGGDGDARARALALVAVAPQEAGAWLLLGAIARQAGDARLAARAARTVRRLGQRPLPGLPVEPEAPANP